MSSPENEPELSASSPSVGPADRIPRDVWGISFTSFFADWGYEMVLPVLPFFLTYTLLASPFVVGAIDGLAQFGQSVMSEISGKFWAQQAARRRIAGFGYAATAIGHALIAVTTTWPQVLGLRLTAWLGRGARQPIKFAIVSNATASSLQGRSFGLEQALDSLGAVLGTAVAIVVLLWAGLDYSGSFRLIFALSAIPSVAALVVLWLFVKDKGVLGAARSTPARTPRRQWVMPRRVRWFFAAEVLFGLGYFSILLALLRVGQALLPSSGGSIVTVVAAALVIYLLYNVVYTVIAYPAGHWSDRFPGIGLVVLSFALFVVVDVLLIAAGGVGGGSLAFLVGISAFVLAGLQVGIQGVAESAWLSRQVDRGDAGRAFGRLGLLQGLAILAGSLLAGGLWTYVSAEWAFSVSAVLCAAGAGLAWAAGRVRGSDGVRSVAATLP